MAKKATNYEIIQRVTRIIDFMLDGLSRYEIVQFGSKEWDITNRQVDDYIAYANKRIKIMADKIEEQAFSRTRNRLERQYRRAIQKDDGMLARLLIGDMRKLYSHDQAPKAAIDDAGKAVIPVVLNRVSNFLTLIKDADPKAYEAFVKVTTDNGVPVKPKQITKKK